MSKKAIVVHSGGMDSSLCLALAIREFGPQSVLSLTFDYNQRHKTEITQAAKICQTWLVDHKIVALPTIQHITENSLINSTTLIANNNTLVVGRNGLMARLAAIQASSLGAHIIYMGVMGLETSYRDCSRAYMDLKQQILRIDLDDPMFEIRTPLVDMTKKETMALGHRLGVLDFLLEHTITCYNGLPREGCQTCAACKLRNNGLKEFLDESSM